MNLHPENPKCTQAYMLVVRGERENAIKLLESIGYTDAPCQVEMIEGFIRFQEARQVKGRNYGRLVETY